VGGGDASGVGVKVRVAVGVVVGLGGFLAQAPMGKTQRDRINKR